MYFLRASFFGCGGFEAFQSPHGLVEGLKGSEACKGFSLRSPRNVALGFRVSIQMHGICKKHKKIARAPSGDYLETFLRNSQIFPIYNS